MGYSTDFVGSITIDPPLSEAERDYVNLFGSTRRMDRAKGPYHCGGGYAGQDHDSDIRDYNKPPEGQPGLWCQWEVSEDGSKLAWNQAEKFYDSQAWMAYLRSHFIALNAAKYLEPEAFGFLKPHAMAGLIHAVGEEVSDDVWRLKVDAEGVWVSGGSWTKKAKVELFKADPDAGGDGEIDWDSMPSMSEAVQASLEEGIVEWGDWERVDDYEDANVGRQVQALREREAVDASALKTDASAGAKKL